MKNLTTIGLVLALAGCGTATPTTTAPGEGTFSIATNTVTDFDATFALGGDWARVRVAYTPSSTMFEITTSHGTTIVRTGTALSGKDLPVATDARIVDDVVMLQAGDPEYAVVHGLLQALLANGASASPDARAAGATIYAAAYFAARSLGLVAVRAHGDFSPVTEWPHPGYRDKIDMPKELLVPEHVGGALNGSGGTTCCGPYECYHCEWNPGTSCDDWCAAGDFCNHWGWGNCGTAFYWPSGGCNSCPHSNSSTIKSYDVQGCNNGSCNKACNDTYSAWDDTFNGPASNFCNYGSYYWGYQCGGEYGNYYGNCGY
jgi:hypothetical protein